MRKPNGIISELKEKMYLCIIYVRNKGNSNGKI